MTYKDKMKDYWSLTQIDMTAIHRYKNIYNKNI